MEKYIAHLNPGTILVDRKDPNNIICIVGKSLNRLERPMFTIRNIKRPKNLINETALTYDFWHILRSNLDA